jgi:hypothetical protein
MAKELIKVGVANSGETNLDIDHLKTWTPKDINYIGTTVFFKNGTTYYSMTREDFKKIYNL